MRIRSRFFTVALALAVVLSATGASRAPSRVPFALLLRVVDSATQAPIPNAEINAGSRRGLTDVRGEVRIPYPEDGELRVRVRQLGYRYVQRTFRRDSASRAGEDTAVVRLARVGWALPQVEVRARQRCQDPGDPSQLPLSEASLELLRFGAEQFDNFRRAYPFDLTMERRTVPDAGGRGDTRTRTETDTTPSQYWGDRYVPDSVIQQRNPYNYFVPLLFVSALADSTFWSRHCFQARGVESRDGRRLIRLDFSPSLDVRAPDWEGTAWLDSARSVLARVDFRLANLRSRYGPEQFEGYTVFSTPTPFIAMPDSTVAWWTTQIPTAFYGQTRRAKGMQTLVIRNVAYRKARPPGTQ